jgi:hypothetical protein
MTSTLNVFLLIICEIMRLSGAFGTLRSICALSFPNCEQNKPARQGTERSARLDGRSEKWQNMHLHCCWGTCVSDSRYREEGVTFIPFPKPKSFPKQAKKWIVLCGRKNFKVRNITKNTYICSKHFKKDDLINLRANPTLEPCKAKPDSERKQTDERRSSQKRIQSPTFSPGKKRARIQWYKTYKKSRKMLEFGLPEIADISAGKLVHSAKIKIIQLFLFL